MSHFSYRRWRVIAACLAVLSGAAAHARLDPSPRSATPGDAYIPRPESAAVLALGQEALLSDLYWLKAVQLIGGARLPAEHAATAGRLVDVATRVDPWVDHPYRFAAVWMVNSAAEVRHANEILRRGIAYHPKDWRNRFYLAFNHYFYLGEEEAAARELEAAVTLPGAPVYLGRLFARLRSQDGDLDVASTFLQELLRQTDDGYAKAEMEKALDEIETERRARFLDAARERYREVHGRPIERIEDLVEGRVLTLLPREPHGWEWVLDENSGEIVSSYYGRRYRLNLPEVDRQRRDRFMEQEAIQRAQHSGAQGRGDE